MQGELPDSTRLRRLVNCERLVFTSNLLTGTVPMSFSLIQSLRMLHIGWNRFSGPFPEAILHLKQMRSLRLERNHFTGPIPDALGKLEHMEWLDLTYNQFEGVVPVALMSWKGMRHCDMRGNDALEPVEIDGEMKAIGNIRDYRAWSAVRLPPPSLDDEARECVNQQEGEDEEKEYEEEEKEEREQEEQEQEQEGLAAPDHTKPGRSPAESMAVNIVAYACRRIETIQVTARRLVDELLDPPARSQARMFLLAILEAMQSKMDEEGGLRGLDIRSLSPRLPAPVLSSSPDSPYLRQAEMFVLQCLDRVEERICGPRISAASENVGTRANAGSERDDYVDGLFAPVVFTRLVSTVQDCARREAVAIVSSILDQASSAMWRQQLVERLIQDAQSSVWRLQEQLHGPHRVPDVASDPQSFADLMVADAIEVAFENAFSRIRRASASTHI